MNKCSRFLDVPHVPPLLVPSSDHGDFGDFRLSKPGFWLSLWARNVVKTQKMLWARANTWHWAHHTPLLGLQNTSGSNAAKCMSKITKHTIVNFRKRRICAAHNHIEFVIAWIILWMNHYFPTSTVWLVFRCIQCSILFNIVHVFFNAIWYLLMFSVPWRWNTKDAKKSKAARNSTDATSPTSPPKRRDDQKRVSEHDAGESGSHTCLDQVPGKTHSQTDEQITSESKKISISLQYSIWISWGKMERKQKVTCPSLNHVVRQEYLATSQSLPSWTTSLSPGFFPLSGGFLACVQRWCSLPHFPHVSRPVGNSTLSSALLPGIVPGPQCLWDAAWKYHQKNSHLASKAMEVPWASSLAIWCLNDVLLEGNWHCSGTSITATKRGWKEKDLEDLASCAAFNAKIPNLNCVHTTATRAAFAKSREKSLNVFLIPS